MGSHLACEPRSYYMSVVVNGLSLNVPWAEGRESQGFHVMML